jgi:hypothetical protein
MFPKIEKEIRESLMIRKLVQENMLDDEYLPEN